MNVSFSSLLLGLYGYKSKFSVLAANGTGWGNPRAAKITRVAFYASLPWESSWAFGQTYTRGTLKIWHWFCEVLSLVKIECSSSRTLFINFFLSFLLKLLRHCIEGIYSGFFFTFNAMSTCELTMSLGALIVCEDILKHSLVKPFDLVKEKQNPSLYLGLQSGKEHTPVWQCCYCTVTT